MYNLNLDFDATDLQANREGRLTPRQRERVESIHASRQRGARWTLIAFLIFIPALLGVGLLNEYRQSNGVDISTFVQTQLPILGIMAGLFAVMLGISAFSQILVSGSARRQRITTAEGQAHIVNLEGNWKRRYARYELHLRRSALNRTVIRFTTPHSLRYFQEGRRYRLYYIPYYPLPIVLSAEEIGTM